MHHVAGYDELAQAFVKTHKYLVGRENHVFMAVCGRYGFNLVTGVLQRGTHCAPLPLSLFLIDRRLPRHVRILPVDNIEVIRRTEENLLGHV